jgi:hypothetical protein
VGGVDRIKVIDITPAKLSKSLSSDVRVVMCRYICREGLRDEN